MDSESATCAGKSDGTDSESADTDNESEDCAPAG